MRQFLTILFADLAGSTRLFQTAGDEAAHSQVAESLRCMRDVIESNNGRLLRTVGDAALASFDRADDAYHAAIGIQKEHQRKSMALRVGFHCGEVIPDSGDIYGNAVNVAARVASFANADEIFTTEVSIEHLSMPLRSQAHYLDRVDFKGIEEPMPVYRIDWANTDDSTHIVTAVSHTTRYHTNQVLEVTVGGRVVQVDPEHPTLTIGRAMDNDIVIDHESASRNHATFEFMHGRYVLKDSSTNGTYVTGTGRSAEFLRREETVLSSAGEIGFGWNPEQSSASGASYHIRLIDLQG